MWRYFVFWCVTTYFPYYPTRFSRVKASQLGMHSVPQERVRFFQKSGWRQKLLMHRWMHDLPTVDMHLPAAPLFLLDRDHFFRSSYTFSSTNGRSGWRHMNENVNNLSFIILIILRRHPVISWNFHFKLGSSHRRRWIKSVIVDPSIVQTLYSRDLDWWTVAHFGESRQFICGDASASPRFPEAQWSGSYQHV